MMESRSVRIIGKYALVLCVLHGLEILMRYFVSQINIDTLDSEMNSYLMVGDVLFPFLLNAIAAIFVNSDIKKEEIEGKYSVLLTVFYRPIGIVLFLIYMINKELNMKTANNKN